MNESIIEGAVKFRYEKKWKKRYCVITRLSPVADCLSLIVFHDQNERRNKSLLCNDEAATTAIDFFVSLKLSEIFSETSLSSISSSAANTNTNTTPTTDAPDAGSSDVVVFAKSSNDSATTPKHPELAWPSGRMESSTSSYSIKGEHHVLGLVTTKRTLLLLGFGNSEEVGNWAERLRHSLTYSTVIRFDVARNEADESPCGAFENAASLHPDGSIIVPSSVTKPRSSHALPLQRGLFCISQTRLFFIRTGQPPQSQRGDREVPLLQCFWEITEIKGYGVLRDDLFAIEGGSKCEKGTGYHYFRASGVVIQALNRQVKLVCSGKLLGDRLPTAGSSANAHYGSKASLSAASRNVLVAASQNQSGVSRSSSLPAAECRRRASAESGSFAKAAMTMMPIDIDAQQSGTLQRFSKLRAPNNDETQLDGEASINQSSVLSNNTSITSSTNQNLYNNNNYAPVSNYSGSVISSYSTLTSDRERGTRWNNLGNVGPANPAAMMLNVTQRATVDAQSDHLDSRVISTLLERSSEQRNLGLKQAAGDPMHSRNGSGHSYENLPAQMSLAVTPNSLSKAARPTALGDLSGAGAGAGGDATWRRYTYTVQARKDDYAVVWAAGERESEVAGKRDGSPSRLDNRSQTFVSASGSRGHVEASMPSPSRQIAPPFASASVTRSTSKVQVTVQHNRASVQLPDAALADGYSEVRPTVAANTSSGSGSGTREKVSHSNSVKLSTNTSSSFRFSRLLRRKQSKSSEDLNATATAAAANNTGDQQGAAAALQPQSMAPPPPERLAVVYQSLNAQLSTLSNLSVNVTSSTQAQGQHAPVGFAEDEDDVFEAAEDRQQIALSLSPIHEDRISVPSVSAHSQADLRTRSDSSQPSVANLVVVPVAVAGSGSGSASASGSGCGSGSGSGPQLGLSNASPVKRRVKTSDRRPVDQVSATIAAAATSNKRDSGSLSGVPSVPEPIPDTLWVRRSRSAERALRRSHHDYQNLPPHTGIATDVTTDLDHYENVLGLGLQAAIKANEATDVNSEVHCTSRADATATATANANNSNNNSNIIANNANTNTNTLPHSNASTMLIKKRELNGQEDKHCSLPRSRSNGHSNSQPQQVNVPPTSTMRPRFGSEYVVPNMAFGRGDTYKQLIEFGIDGPPTDAASAQSQQQQQPSVGASSKPIPISISAKNGLYDSHSYVNVKSLSRTPPDALSATATAGAPATTLVCSDSSPNDSVLSRSVGSQAGYMNLDFGIPNGSSSTGVGAGANTGAGAGSSRLQQPPAEMLNPLLNYADMLSTADGTLTISPSLPHSRSTHSNSSPSPTAANAAGTNKRSPENAKLSAVSRPRAAAAAAGPGSISNQARIQPPQSAPQSVSPKRASPSNAALSRSPSRGAPAFSAAQRELNYADLDFSKHPSAPLADLPLSSSAINASGNGTMGTSASASGSNVAFRAGNQRGDQTEYALIDVVRTDALSRLAKEHPAQRFRDQQAAAANSGGNPNASANTQNANSNASGNTDPTQAGSANRRSLLPDWSFGFRQRTSESTA